MFVVIKISVPF